MLLRDVSVETLLQERKPLGKPGKFGGFCYLLLTLSYIINEKEQDGVFIVHEDKKTALRWFSAVGLPSRHTRVWQTPPATDGCHTMSEHTRKALHQ